MTVWRHRVACECGKVEKFNSEIGEDDVRAQARAAGWRGGHRIVPKPGGDVRMGVCPACVEKEIPDA